MATIGILTLFTLFGAVSAFFLTVVGFGVVALIAVALLGVFGAVTGAGFTAWTLGGSFVALQVGYVAGVLASAVIGPLRQASRKDARRLRGDLHIKHD